MNKFYSPDLNKLDDKAIIKALRKAVRQYANGEIEETNQTLSEIIEAINDWDLANNLSD